MKTFIFLTFLIFVSCSQDNPRIKSLVEYDQLPRPAQVNLSVGFDKNPDSINGPLLATVKCNTYCEISSMLTRNEDIDTIDKPFYKPSSLLMDSLHGEYYLYIQARGDKGQLSKLYKRKLVFNDV